MTRLLLAILRSWPFRLEWCPTHEEFRRIEGPLGSLCSRCMKRRDYDAAVRDMSPAWLKSEGSWPTSIEPVRRGRGELRLLGGAKDAEKDAAGADPTAASSPSPTKTA